LEAVSVDGPDKNWIYGISNITAENLQTTWSVLIVGCSQSVSSTQTLEFKEILNQRVKAWTTHLAIETQQLSAEMTKLDDCIWS
jgi:hypothetical protein